MIKLILLCTVLPVILSFGSSFAFAQINNSTENLIFNGTVDNQTIKITAIPSSNHSLINANQSIGPPPPYFEIIVKDKNGVILTPNQQIRTLDFPLTFNINTPLPPGATHATGWCETFKNNRLIASFSCHPGYDFKIYLVNTGVIVNPTGTYEIRGKQAACYEPKLCGPSSYIYHGVKFRATY